MLKVTVNGYPWEGLVKSDQSLLDFLRDELGLTGAKKGCDGGECGACVVLLDGRAVNSCLIPVLDVNNCEVRTIEGLQDEQTNQLQDAFVSVGAVQCGFCTPGMIVAARALLAEVHNPGEEEIREAMVGHLCRCTGYTRIAAAIKLAASRINPETAGPER